MPNRSVQLDLDPQVSIAPQSIGGAVNGAGIDLSQCDAALILLDSGAATTPATVVIQESSDNATWTAVADTDLIGVSGNAAGVAQVASSISKVSYVGSKQYVRVTTTAGAAALFSAEVIRAHLRRTTGQPV